MLRVEGLTKRFAGLAAVREVDLTVERGQVHGVIGPNGAGKTTLFNLISGFLRPDEGDVWYDDQPIGRLPVHRRAGLGIVRTFQNIRLFGGLTVRENVLVGQHRRAAAGRSIAPWRSSRERRLAGEADELLALFRLGDYAHRRAADLPYGVQKRLELARAVATQPQLLLLDEPTAGMNEHESQEIVAEVRAIRDRGVTVLLVEHDMNVVMQVSDQVTVLNFGRKIAEGSPAAVQADAEVRLAYLGE